MNMLLFLMIFRVNHKVSKQFDLICVSDNLMAFIKVLRSFVACSTIAVQRKRSGSFHTERTSGSEIINNSRKFAPYFARNSRHRRLREIHAIICGKSCRTDLTNPAQQTSHFSGCTQAHMHKKESDGNYYREQGNDFVFATEDLYLVLSRRQ